MARMTALDFHPDLLEPSANFLTAPESSPSAA
jgi:hypothetical protein